MPSECVGLPIIPTSDDRDKEPKGNLASKTSYIDKLWV